MTIGGLGTLVRFAKRRRLVVVVPLVLCILALTAAPAAIALEARIPTSAEDWASFTAAEGRAALDHARQQFEASMRDGTAVINTVGRDGSGVLAQSSDVSALAVTADYN